MHQDIVPFVDMAHIQPAESILDLGCGSALVGLRAKDILGANHGTIVGIDNSRIFRQKYLFPTSATIWVIPINESSHDDTAYEALRLVFSLQKKEDE